MKDYSTYTTAALNTLRAAHSVDDSYSSFCTVRAIDEELKERVDNQEENNMTTSYAEYKAAQQAEADAWMEAHSADLYEPRRNDDREILAVDYGDEYFDMDALADVDYDDLDYYTKMGIYAARSRRGRIEYRAWTGDLEAGQRAINDVDTAHGSMSVSSPDMMVEPARRIPTEVVPFRGVPVRTFKGPAIAPTSYQSAIKAEAAPKKPRTTRMDRLRAKADRRAK